MEENFIIETLYYGNYQSGMETLGLNPEYITIMKDFRELEKKLTDKMSESDQQEFEIMMDKKADAEDILEADAFLFGFRLATRLLISAL